MSAPEPRTETRVVSEGFLKRYLSGPGQFAIAVAACFAFVLAAYLLTPGSPDDARPKTVDYSFDAKGFARAAEFGTYTPEGLPAGWYATASRLTGAQDEDADLTWHVGFATPDGAHAAVIQSDEKPDGVKGFVRRMTNVPQSGPDQSIGSQTVNGAAWSRYHQRDKRQNSLVLRQPGNTVVVTGTASWAELAVLAGSLKAQPPGGQG